MNPFSKKTLRHLKEALQEDLGKGDITSKLLMPAGSRSKAIVLARQKGVFCGEAVVRTLFRLVDASLKIRMKIKDGSLFSSGQILFEVRGKTSSMLAAERTVLNFLARLGGIATLTRQFVEKVKPYRVEILDTRKTTPLWRELEKYAVMTGGGRNHRMGLYDEIFVKENHRVHGQLDRLKRWKGKFEIEVRNQKELEEVLRLKPRVVLFDNWRPDALKRAVKRVKRQMLSQVGARHARLPARQAVPLLEASGGITLANVRKYAATGIDWISAGALTHSSPSVNLSLLIQ